MPKHRWHLCPHCQAMMKKLGLNNEDELQCCFMNRINDYCAGKNKQAFMWSWDLKDDKLLSENLGFTKCGDINTGGRPFIDTSSKAYYIDLPYGYISLKIPPTINYTTEIASVRKQRYGRNMFPI